MPPATIRTLCTTATLAWLAVCGYGVWEIAAQNSGENWEPSYTIFNVALLLAASSTLAAVWIASRLPRRPMMRTVGLAICVLGAVSAIVAWALPLWMTLLGVGFSAVALSGARINRWRAPVAYLAASQLVGMATLFVAIAAKPGRTDEYGDHPAAFGIGLAVTAAATIASLVQLGRCVDPRLANEPDLSVPALAGRN